MDIIRHKRGIKLSIIGSLMLIAWFCASGPTAAQPIIPSLPPDASSALVLVPGMTITFTLDGNTTSTQLRYIFLARQGEMIAIHAVRTAGDGVLDLKLSSGDGTMLDEEQPTDIAGKEIQLNFPVTADGWYWLDAALDLNSGGSSGTFDLQLTGTTPYLITAVPSQFPLTVSVPPHLADLFTLTSSPTMTETLTLPPTETLSPTFTPSLTRTPTNTLTPSLTGTPSLTFTPSLTLTPSITPSSTATRKVTITPTPSRTKTPTITPTDTDSPSSTPNQCPGAPPEVLQPGMQAQITPGTPNRLRSSPGLNGAVITNMPGAALVTIIDGPICKDGYAWWHVTYNYIDGWTVDGKDGEYWIVPLQ